MTFPDVHTTHSTQHSMVQTRAQERGAPLKKPGAYDTDAYYNEVDQGFGDVGGDQVGAKAVCTDPHKMHGPCG